MPRGNPAVWKRKGASYADLAGTTTSDERACDLAPRRLPAAPPAELASLRALAPAGVPAGTLPRGTGTFLLQSRWSLSHSPHQPHQQCQAQEVQQQPPGPPYGRHGSAPGGLRTAGAHAEGLPPRRTFSTEAATQFRPPPAGHRPPASTGLRPSAMPRPCHPSDWLTAKQADYRPDALARCARSLPARRCDAGRLLPADVPPASQFGSSQRDHFPARSALQARGTPAAGRPAAQAPGYNIITGAGAGQGQGTGGNNVFERWEAGRDYRRHR